jgi:hypothetical protein
MSLGRAEFVDRCVGKRRGVKESGLGPADSSESLALLVTSQ